MLIRCIVIYPVDGAIQRLDNQSHIFNLTDLARQEFMSSFKREM